MTRTLIIGATSAIATAYARRLAARGERLHLMARNLDRLAMMADDLRVRGATNVDTTQMEATAFEHHQRAIDAAWDLGGGFDTAIIVHGTLPDQRACEASFEAARHAFEVNALGVHSFATWLAPRFEQQRSGTLVVVSSVAGDRGRQSNYVYGAAKAAVDVFFEGLRNRLHRAGVQVLTIKPGFVDTPMTESFAKGPLWASPETVAAGIDRAIRGRRDVVYLPWFWRPIMFLIRAVPEWIFKRLSL